MVFAIKIPNSSIVDLNKKMCIYVTELETSTQFWFQRIGEEYSQALESLHKKMEEIYNSKTAADSIVNIAKVYPGLPVAAKYGDGFNRGIIQDINWREGSLLVFFCDYGTKCEIPVENVRLLYKPFAELKMQAFKARLFGLSETGRKDEAYNQVLDIVSKNTKGFCAELKIKDLNENCAIPLYLESIDSGNSLNLFLVREKICKKTKEMNEKTEFTLLEFLYFKKDFITELQSLCLSYPNILRYLEHSEEGIMDILQKAKAEMDKKQTETKKHKILEQELVDCKEDESINDDPGVVNEIIVHTENNENQSFNEFRSNCNYQAEESDSLKEDFRKDKPSFRYKSKYMHFNFSEESTSASLDIAGGGVDFDSISDIDNDPAILCFTIHDIDIKNIDDNKVGKTNSQQDIHHTIQEIHDDTEADMQEKIDSNRNCGEQSVSNKNNNQNNRTTKYSNFRSSTPERKNKIKGNIQIEKIFQADVDKIMKNLFKDDNDDAANIISDNELDIITPHYIARSSKEKSDDKTRDNVNDVKIIHDTGVHKDRQTNQNIQKDTERMKNSALGNSKSTYTKNIDSDNNDTFENSTSAKDDDFDNSMTAKNDDCENMIAANDDDSENMSAVKNDDFSNMIAATNDEFEKMTFAENVDYDNLIDAMNSDFKNLRVAKDDTFEDLTAMKNNDFDNFIPPNYHDFDNLKASKNNDFNNLKVLKDNALIKLKESENVVDNDDFNQEANTKQTSSKHRILEKYKSRANSNSKRSEILERFKALRAQKANTSTDPPREVATNIAAANNTSENPPAYLYVPIPISGTRHEEIRNIHVTISHVCSCPSTRPYMFENPPCFHVPPPNSHVFVSPSNQNSISHNQY